MITVSNVSLSYGERPLFKEVNLKFTAGNCYGVIGANGAGKSTFLKILSGEIQADTGEISIGSGQRMAVLKQDQFAFDAHTVLETVIMGYEELYRIGLARDEIYAKAEFTEEDGIRAGELEAEFGEIGGWEAESEAASMLAGLGIEEGLHDKLMEELDGGQKVRVLLAQALFGTPDILLLDEPTNNLDLESVTWLEDFLSRFPNTVIVVSHDRHFLNKVCTHIADIDFNRIRLYVGNYDFWYAASQLISRQRRDEKKKTEEKAKELKEFIQRFSSNASKAKQATSRKKLLEKLTLDELPQSARRFPYVGFKPERDCGKIVLEMRGLEASFEGEKVLENFSLTVNPGDKIAFVGPRNQAKSALFEIISGRAEPEAGTYSWGVTIAQSYFPKDAGPEFPQDESILEWLQRFSPDPDPTYLRGFLGRMLFSGDEALKSTQVLSGGEKVRCLLSRMMLTGSNVLILDEPTNHLDLEAITALNDGLIEFPGVVLFNSHDHQFVDSIANRIVEITPDGVIDRMMRFDDYLKNADVARRRDELYHEHIRIAL
ncbi:MAG: ATP-binding cassette domain-containing protein [Spirochaetaceae bacterium]|nr:MAG: ATP-binding cassette domain-containing protein [Spirochaetaceae bacterium]